MFVLACGIPSITLRGTEQDYVSIIKRLDGIRDLGPEADAFVTLLRPILQQFVIALSKGPEACDSKFWSRICHYKDWGSGAPMLSGWITAFCVWNTEGKWQGYGPDGSKGAMELIRASPGTESDGKQWPFLDHWRCFLCFGRFTIFQSSSLLFPASHLRGAGVPIH